MALAWLQLGKQFAHSHSIMLGAFMRPWTNNTGASGRRSVHPECNVHTLQDQTIFGRDLGMASFDFQPIHHTFENKWILHKVYDRLRLKCICTLLLWTGSPFDIWMQLIIRKELHAERAGWYILHNVIMPSGRVNHVMEANTLETDKLADTQRISLYAYVCSVGRAPRIEDAAKELYCGEVFHRRTVSTMPHASSSLLLSNQSSGNNNSNANDGQRWQ